MSASFWNNYYRSLEGATIVKFVGMISVTDSLSFKSDLKTER